MLCLKLFGGSSLESDQGPLTGPAAQRRRVALLALLAATHPSALPRDKLLTYLWPERDTEHARNLLSQAVYVLRKALGEEAILAAGDELRLNTAVVACDVVRFEQALQANDLARAVDLYAGPFLDGFYLPSTPEFEHWAAGERDRYGRAYGIALQGLAESAAAEGDSAGAANWWRRRAAMDPYNARVTLHLMEALEVTGDRVGALQQARVHAALLEQEFGIGPDPKVTELAERLCAGSVRPSRSVLEQAATGPQPWAPPAHPAMVEEIACPVDSASVVPSEQAPEARRADRRPAILSAVAALGFAALLTTSRFFPDASARPPAATDAAAASPKAIAVLPCANLSRDPAEEYFSDGLTEELIGVLSQVRALQVVARTSAFAFKGQSRDVREIGRTLNVGTVLECSVRREGDRVRVIAQLINASNGFHLWSETSERAGPDIFAIQSELALQIVRALEAELTPGERERIARRPTANPEAHALYLKGRYFWNQRTREGFARAVEYFERAIEVDPQYAAAHAGLALVSLLRGLQGDLAPDEAGERTRQAALRALELDDALAEAHVVLGGYLNLYAWDSEAAELEFRRAIALDPSYAYGRHSYAVFLTQRGRFEEALIQRQKAVELDPLDPHLISSLGGAFLHAGRSEEAFAALHHALELDSTYWEAHARLARLHGATGRLEESVRAYRRAAELAGTNSNAKAWLASALAQVGRGADARRMLAELQAEAVRTGIYAPYVAPVFVALDDLEGALVWLERSYQQRHPQLRFIGDQGYSRLASTPRYLDLRRRIGLPP